MMTATAACLLAVTRCQDIDLQAGAANAVAHQASGERFSRLADQAAGPSAPISLVGVDPDDWKLVFHDEFAGNSLDLRRWTLCYWWDDDGCTNEGNEELQWYLPDNVSVQGGMLRLQARRERVVRDGKVYPYTSGMVTTGRDKYKGPNPDRFAFRYGYAEMRAKLPSGRGLWPAFWLLPSNQNPSPEIDVMEVWGHELRLLWMTFHFFDEDGDRQRKRASFKGTDLSRDWHRYGLEWGPDRIVWYLDGVERARFTDRRYIPDERMYLLVNLAVDRIEGGPPDEDTKFPADMLVDYVRVWQRP